MAKALHVLEPESDTWIPHQRILLMCHGLNLSHDDGDIDRDFACLLMGQFLADWARIGVRHFILRAPGRTYATY